MKRIIMNEYKEMDFPKGIVTKVSIGEIFYYKEGQLYYRETFHPRSVKDQIAGSVQKNNYTAIGAGGKKHYAHRLIWILHNGEIPIHKVIDHIDRNSQNNNIENLRLITKYENRLNTDPKGYVFNKARNRYIARISIHKKVIKIGSYKTPEEATAAYRAAKKIYHTIE